MLIAPKPPATNELSTPPVAQSAPSWSAPVQTLLDHPPAKLPSQLAIGGLIFCTAMAAWAWFGQIDQVATARGKLIPQGDVHRVNAHISGKVAAVSVQEGDSIQAGQVLLKLDSELDQTEINRLQELLQGQQTELAQTRTLLDKTRLQLQSRSTIAQSEIAAQSVAISQALDMVTNQRSMLSQLQADATAQQERHDRLQPLVTEGALPQERLFELEHLLRDRQRSMTETEGLLQQKISEVNQLKVGLTKKQAEAKQTTLEAQQQIQELQVHLTELQAKVTETTSLIATAKARLKQNLVYAPTTGVVTSLNVRNRGEATQAGQVIAEIAPTGKPLVLTTWLPNQEAGFVKLGMPVKIKLDAYPYQDYGVLPGAVMAISPDSKLDQQLGQVYRVDVELRQSDRTSKIQLKAGQTAVAEIVTHHRRIIDVLFDPLKKIQAGISL